MPEGGDYVQLPVEEVAGEAVPRPLPQYRGIPIHRELAYVIIVVAVATASGGVILGAGAFGAKMEREKLATELEMSRVFDGGFQAMTWFSVMWCLLQSRLGPKCCTVLGCLLAAAGNALLSGAAGRGCTNALVYTAAYGLMGGGGNAVVFSTFHYTTLFANVGTRCALLSASFAAAGLVFLLLNADAISIHAFFGAYAVYQLAFGAVALVLIPDKPYTSPTDECVLSLPSLCPRSRRCSDSSANDSGGGGGGGSGSGGGGGGGAGGGGNSGREHDDLWHLRVALTDRRFLAFAATFAWTTLVAEWVGGAIFAVEVRSEVG